MADFYSIEGLEDIIAQGRTGIANLMADAEVTRSRELIQKTIDDIQTAIAYLKSQEGQFLSLFGCLDIDEFKSRVNNYYNYTAVGHFTGSNLKKIVDDYAALNDKKMKHYQDLIERISFNLLNDPTLIKDFNLSNEIIQAFKSQAVTEQMAQEMSEYIIKALSGSIVLGGGGSLQSTSFGSSTKGPNGAKTFQLAARLTTEAFREHLADLEMIYNNGRLTRNMIKILNKEPAYKNLSTEEKRVFRDDIVNNARLLLKPITNSSNTRISGGGMQQTFSYQFSVLIGSVTKGNTGKLSDLNVTNEELDKVNLQIKDLIIDELMSAVGSNDGEIRGFLNDRIYSMMKTDRKMFLIGGSANQLNGLLGEINAIIALTALLGDKYKPRIIKWAGSQLGMASKKKPSVDIVLKDICGLSYGIQIKNTTKDLDDDFLHKIGFADSSVDNIFNKLGIQEAGIQDVLIADTFNVPYKKQGRNMYVQVGPGTTFDNGTPHDFSRFLAQEKIIDELTNDINNYLRMFSSDFLYIGLGEDFESKLAILDLEILDNVGGNYVYIVGPKVFFASEILEQLSEDLELLQQYKTKEEAMHFQLENYFELNKNEKAYNIVTVLNTGGSGSSVRTLKMRSSYTFSNK